MRVFFDTNVLVSAFTSQQGLCASVFSWVTKAPEHELIVGEVTLVELEKVLLQRFKFSSQEVEEVLGFLRKYRVVPEPATTPNIPVRDPDDALVLASALEAQADALVTGDQDLLVLGGTAGKK
ncbi:MAG: putative toxin-antitoxin system toxin component, PIN family [Nitrospinales bacterium]